MADTIETNETTSVFGSLKAALEIGKRPPAVHRKLRISYNGKNRLIDYVPDIRLAAERRKLRDFQFYANRNPHGLWFKVKHSSFVYFAVAVDHPDKWIKIGHSKDPKTRMGNLRLELRADTGVSSQVKLLAAIPGNLHTESYAHAAFEEFRVHGEWYSQAEPITALIAEIRAADAALQPATGGNQ